MSNPSSTDAALDPHSWSHKLDTLHDHAWQRLTRGVHDRHAPSRHPTLATVSPEGLPQARTVVLRTADRSSRRLEIHTNLYSAKVDELRHMPVAALHVWDSGSSLQMRLLADVTITSGADAAAAWSAVPERSRRAYSSDHRPGRPIASALDYEHKPDLQAFAILSLELRQMDLLHLGVQHHRRALFSRDNDWAGQWLVP